MPPCRQGAGGVADTVGRSRSLDLDEVAGAVAFQSATGCFTRPSEVADLVLFLAGPGAANITGADFVVGGGLVDSLWPGAGSCGRPRGRPNHRMYARMAAAGTGSRAAAGD
ncbi:SDR family oxidoreductase [Streptomyces sp. NRRL B-24484]|uniref:SDR family oxidoreductase n=1 Tax=Streptomyces sp. NRRL B-24484 TaxID=1463833 RepID=UPI0004C09BF9|nr:SDR family oxidoreductase [Streptomyces sp. NRRL B-24484]